MSIGFPAHYSASIKNKSNYSIKELIKILKKTTFIIQYNSDGNIFLKAQLNAWSWGESIKITLNKEGDNSINILSKCTFPLQILDWGKNKKNVDMIVELLSK